MFPELTELKHLIIKPSDDRRVNPAAWSELTKLIRCTFVLSERQQSRWRAQGITGGELMAPVQRIPSVTANLEKVLHENNLEPHEVAYVTGDAHEIGVAANARVGTILLAAERGDLWPDLMPNNVETVVKHVNSYLDGEAVGYFGEVVSTLDSSGQQAGKRGYLVKRNVLTGVPDNVRGIALGRYFPKSDVLHLKHQYTRRILTMKDRLDKPLGEMLVRVLEHVNEDIEAIDFITTVPPKPSSKRAGLRDTVALAARLSKLVYRPDALHCPEDYPNQRDVPSSQRAQNVAGKFRSGNFPRAEHVVLIDDVITTGSTVGECARVLLDRGVRRITVIGFSVTQESARYDRVLACYSCGNPMVCRFRKDMHTPLFGCSTYPNCRSTLSWDDGIVKWNRLNTRDQLSTSWDIQSF